MADKDLIREIVTRACCDALQQKSQELAEEVARRASDELARTGEEPALQAAPAKAPRERTQELLDGALLISASRTQSETLDTLLAAASSVTPSCGLMILRGAQATGWNCNGLATLEAFKRTTMDCAQGVVARVISSCAAVVAEASELDPGFRAAVGLENSSQLLLVPILLKGRVAALLIALPQQSDDLAAMELLVQITQLALELQAFRKTAPKPPAEVPPPAVVQRAAAPEPTPAVEKPEAAPQSFEPKPEAASQSFEPKPEPELVYAPTAAAAAAPVERPAAEPAYASAAPIRQIATPVPQLDAAAPQSAPPMPDEVHEKARRFAKLLVEEIRLYNQTKLAEGRARGDLYSRLREDIEKSRGAYHKRYGESVRDVDYFTQELLRILADNNRAVMGPGFPG